MSIKNFIGKQKDNNYFKIRNTINILWIKENSDKFYINWYNIYITILITKKYKVLLKSNPK